VTLRLYNGRWLIFGSGIANSDVCCCPEPPPPGSGTYPCDCFDFWPESLTLDITGLADYPVPGAGLCNCPADGYGPGFNQSVVLDFAGVVTFDGCPALPGTANSRVRTLNSLRNATVYSDQNPFGLAVYRGSMTNGSCDEYGVEAILNKSAFGGFCDVTVVLDKLAAGSPDLCDPWLQASAACSAWVLGGTFNTSCASANLTVQSSYFGGDATMGQTAATVV
jgi:hypothetical protein